MTMPKLELYFSVWVDEKTLNIKLSFYVNVKLKKIQQSKIFNFFMGFIQRSDLSINSETNN